ncbi:MAG: hypothetical protein K0B08_01975 [Bacteroidales bacterium]|nr:hypothetical protein [Bacteroidales bacterium]
MKTMIVTAAMMLLLTTASAWASEDSSATFSPVAENQLAFIKLQPSNIIEFRVVNADHEKITFTIYAEKNNKIYKRTLRNDHGIRFGCDMRDFGRGSYECVIEQNGTEIARRTVTLK